MAQIERPLTGGRPSRAVVRASEEPAARDYFPAAAAALVTVAGLCALFLFPYLTKHFRYPLGWDAAATVREAELTAFGGLVRFGSIRVGSSLLLTALMPVTRQSAFTLVALGPAVFAGVAALAAAAMVRAAFDIGARWVPVVGFLTWAAFGGNGMLNLHLDNVVNSALTLAALAAALAYVADRRGLTAASVLFAAAGLAHWPFWLFAMAVYVVAVLAYLWPSVRSSGPRALASPLLVPAVSSGAFVACTFLAIPASSFLGARLGSLNTSLRQRLIQRLGEGSFYAALPFAGAGAIAAARAPIRSSTSKAPARRLFLWIMATWVILTFAGAIAQWAGVPTAGGRLLLYLFPVTILAGVFTWRFAVAIAARTFGPWSPILGTAVVTLVVAGFGFITIAWRAPQHPWIDQKTAEQVAASGAYVRHVGGNRPIVYLVGKSLTGKPSIRVVQAVLPADLAVRATQFYGTPSGFLSGAPPERGSAGTPLPRSRSIVIAVQGLGPKNFRSAAAADPNVVVAPGVAVVQGPGPMGPVGTTRTPMANTGRAGLVLVPLVILVTLLLAGGGWSLTLLPPDPIVRVALAPALGMALISIAALVWDRVGLSLKGNLPLAPVLVAAASGWVAAAVVLLRRRTGSRASA